MGEVGSISVSYLMCDDPREIGCHIRTREVTRSMFPQYAQTWGWRQNQQTRNYTCPICQRLDSGLQGPLNRADGNLLLSALFFLDQAAAELAEKHGLTRESVGELIANFKEELHRRLTELYTLRALRQ